MCIFDTSFADDQQINYKIYDKRGKFAFLWNSDGWINAANYSAGFTHEQEHIIKSIQTGWRYEEFNLITIVKKK